eukprot:scaffold16485_cov65-Phaeocystis_antarctica.AAC.3
MSCCWYLYYGANARDNITLLRTLAGPDGTGYDRCLHVSIVVRIVRRRVVVDVLAQMLCGQRTIDRTRVLQKWPRRTNCGLRDRQSP